MGLIFWTVYIFSLPCFCLAVQPILSTYFLEGVSTRNTYAITKVPSQQGVRCKKKPETCNRALSKIRDCGLSRIMIDGLQS